jgi:hypothetical protein
MGALAEMERELISERTAAALAHKKASGQRLGAAPLGFRLRNGSGGSVGATAGSLTSSTRRASRRSEVGAGIIALWRRWSAPAGRICRSTEGRLTTRWTRDVPLVSIGRGAKPFGRSPSPLLRP